MSIIKDNKNLFTLEKNKAGAQRKMAAIFAADVVGYSKLMAQNEKLTLFRLKETRKTTDPIIENLGGRIFSTAGDSIMAEFASPVDAVEAAIEIQNKVTNTASEINDGVIIEFRIGVNLGDIMVQDNNLYGDNVNIAARLESISKPSEICISEKVYQEIKNKVNVNFNFIGTKKLKNISEKINVYSSNLTSIESSNLKKNFLNKKVIIGLLFAALFISIFFIYKYFSSDRITYNQSNVSNLDDFKASEDIKPSGSLVEDNILKISLMNFKNQSSTFSSDKLNILMENIKSTLTEKDMLATVISPEGSENLNPPEVMLIATEANSSFVINGLVFSESNENFLTIKVYEAKRGSMIIGKKINLDDSDNYNEAVKFFTLFKNDVLK
ncbi:MAG: adenylate/guanylate cyclase domain-containing protein [Alphaproteobacteria bacterium TMED93]|nr:MAG: adenylate/guanylate cyclase domain-containing protein [Alphaproteobacteria bacterium TMED93]